MIGNYNNKLDDKSRLIIPAKFRNTLGSVIVISYGFDKTLEIRSLKSFEQWQESLTSKGNLNSNARNLSRLILGNSFDIEIDKSGRALIPSQLRDLVGLTKEVTLVGVGDKIEVHSSAAWNATINDQEAMAKSLEEMAQELSKSE